MRRKLSPQEKAFLKRWYSNEILDQVILAFGKDTHPLFKLIRLFFKGGALPVGWIINLDDPNFRGDTVGDLALLAHEIVHLEQRIRYKGEWISQVVYLAHWVLPVIRYIPLLVGSSKHRNYDAFLRFVYPRHPMELAATRRQVEALEILEAKDHANYWRRWIGEEVK